MLAGPCPTVCIDLLLSMCILQRILLVEVHLKSTKGKKETPQEVERLVALVGDTPAEAEHAVLGLGQVNRVVCPLLISHSSSFALTKEDATLAMVFALIAPFYRGVSADELQCRVPALCVNALKLPSAFSSAMNRMLLSYNILLSNAFSMTDAATMDQLGAKMKVFDALAPLNDKCVPADAFKVVLLMYLTLECMPHLFTEGSPQDCFGLLNNVWRGMEMQAPLLDAHKLDLPIKGNELRRMLGLEPKEIGSTLLEVRKMIVLNPSHTRESIIQQLQTQVRKRDI
ncbi:tRNA nucleotidyltransferase [Strigomonas culicis]|uniref:tRNA nucleotidyltransferase n=2 Tax=Strigomonas culicis TaxID=28005 RepID=S9USX7_9TRYP|nr:tRNA nucleotidyltransferase [Strigomonas culicis]|eukprot:EPY31998.1 tRNA nucleotidyltransferase [Strigomonas culicis]